MTDRSAITAELKDEKNRRVEFFSAAADVLSALDNIGYKVLCQLLMFEMCVENNNDWPQVISSSSHVTGPKQYSSKDFIWTLHKQSRYDIDI